MGHGNEPVMYCAWSKNDRIALASDDCVVAVYKSDIDRITKQTPESEPVYGAIVQGKKKWVEKIFGSNFFFISRRFDRLV